MDDNIERERERERERDLKMKKKNLYSIAKFLLNLHP